MYRIKQRQAWLLLGWVTAERSCPWKQPACLAIAGGSEVTFKPLVLSLVMFVFVEFLCLEKCRGKTRKYNKATHQLNGRRDSAITLSTRPLDFDLCLRMGRVLKVIKDAQQQHGLRHSDYQRYRGYCTRRIRRLRKVLHILQGDKRNFKRRDVTEEKLKDERYLLIPLMLAERAWSHAMQLRQEANTEPRKRFRLVHRLRKATVYALQLQKLCETDKCDARTKLEAQAYVAWIHGSLHFELQLWKPAMENLNKAKYK
ncbi:signal recognition particle subunit srp68 [Homalodisca vitripennis]|nr:signal recognition particle subunit srp68 [Homalodisca vitripennis]